MSRYSKNVFLIIRRLKKAKIVKILYDVHTFHRTKMSCSKKHVNWSNGFILNIENQFFMIFVILKINCIYYKADFDLSSSNWVVSPLSNGG